MCADVRLDERLLPAGDVSTAARSLSCAIPCSHPNAFRAVNVCSSWHAAACAGRLVLSVCSMMHAESEWATSDHVRRRPSDDASASKMRRRRHQPTDASDRTALSPPFSPPSSRLDRPGSSFADSVPVGQISPASQLSSLRRLSACTVSLSRKPTDSAKSSAAARSWRLTPGESSEEQCSDESDSEESEYRLSDDSCLSSPYASSSDSDRECESSLDRQRRLHRLRQAWYVAKKRQHLQPSCSQAQSKAGEVVAAVAKRRLSSSSHLSPAMLPVVKAQVVEWTQQPVLATVIRGVPVAKQQLVTSQLHSAKQQVLFMSPLTLGQPAALTAVSSATLSSIDCPLPSAALDMPEPFLNVSVDVYYVILSFLHPIDLLKLSAVSSAASRSTSNPYIWRPLVHQPWPISCDHSHDWKRVYCTRIKRALAGARYFCTFCACTRTFKQDGALEAHVAKHSEQRTVYPCTVAGCGLSFDTARRLRYHVKRHNSGALASTKTHACDWSGCKLTFPTPYALSLHRCRHTGKKRPHACKLDGCNRSFNSRHALALHVDTHNPKHERTLSFPCTVAGCDHTYLTKSGLSKHVVKQHGGTVKRAVRLVCQVKGCGRQYHYQSELRRHMSKRHRREDEEVDEMEVKLEEEEDEETEEERRED